MNTLIRIAFLTALCALVVSCEFLKENDLLEEVKKDPPVAGADTDTADKDDVMPDVDNAVTCGNGGIDGTEECDSSSGTASLLCAQLDADQYSGGTANCTANCMWDRSGCIAKTCGDGTVQTSEQCDISLSETKLCVDIDPNKYTGGQATCADNCTWDLDPCILKTCGNGTVETGEDCEGDMDKDCAEIEKVGTIVCDAETCKWNTEDCQIKPVCGNDLIEGNETCDGGAKPCVQVDPETWISGDAYCNSTCNGWDIDACEPKPDACTCGNGMVETTADGCSTDEVCEPTETTTCNDLALGAATTTVNCKTDCTGWDTSVCPQIQVQVFFETTFILDASRLGEETYIDAHQNAFLTETVFSGTWEGSVSIPPIGSIHQAVVVRSTDGPIGPAIIVQENYFDDSGVNPETPSTLTLNFPTDEIPAPLMGLPADYQIGLTQEQIKLFAYEDSDGNGPCIKYVATGGTITVTEAQNTTVIDGGSLSGWTNGQYIPLTDAAVQNIGQELQLGYTFYRVCGGQSCGDGIINGSEQCDMDDLVEFDCAKISKTYNGGTASCNSSNCQWDFSQCQAAPTCGDNNIDDGEICDDGNTTPGDGCSSNCKFVDNNCAAITAGAFAAQMGSGGVSGDMAMFVTEFTPTEGSGSIPELLFFYIDTDFIPVKSQAYPITEAVKNDYGLQAMVDYDGMNGTVGTAFAAYAGQMHFTDYDLDGNGKFTDSAWGQVDLVYFGEIDTQGKWVQNGQCRYLASASWDLIDYPVITDLTAAYGGNKDNIQIQWTAPQNASRYNQYRICVDGAGCLDVSAGMSPGGTESRYVGVSWYSGSHTISVQPLRDGTVAATAATVDVDTNGHAELAPVSGIDFGLVGYNSYLDRAVTINNTSTLVDLVINETTLPMDCTGKVTILSGEATPTAQVTVTPGNFHAVVLRYAPTEVSACTDGQFRAQYIVTDNGGPTYSEETLPVIGSSENTPPVITDAYFSPNPVKNADNASVIRVYFEDDNGVCNGIGTDIVEAVWDMRELGGGPREDMWNSSCATDTHQFWFWKSIDVSALGNGIYVIPVTITDSAGHTVKKNVSFAVYSGNILEVGDGKTFSSIKDAVNAAGNYDVVTVHPGTYSGTGNSDINPGSKAIMIYGIEGPDETIIDAIGMLNPTFAIDHDNGNLYIGGFSLRNNPGGAMWMGAAPNNQKVSVTDCRFEENSNSGNGAGIVAANDKVDLTVAHTVFRANSASLMGGAVYAGAGAKLFFVDVLFEDNTAQQGGALATNVAGPITFDRCAFVGNEGTVQGGALNFVSANGAVEMRNCIVAGNTSGGHGGGIFVDDSVSLPVTLKIYNSTIVENVATYDGGGINMIKGSFEMKDSILFFNQAGSGLTTQLVLYDDGSAPYEIVTATVDNCAIGGGTNPISDDADRINTPSGFVAGAHGNIIADPLFVGGTGNGVLKYQLGSGSPCIDTGSEGTTVPTYDFLGYAKNGAKREIGAFEYLP